MKIGILTHWWSEDNYGQQLQCFALQRYLKNAGHEPFLIRYLPGKDIIKISLFKRLTKVFEPLFLYRYVKRRIVKLLGTHKKEYVRRNKEREFKQFRLDNIVQSSDIYYSWEQLKMKPPIADVYIVGSDQVWNFHKQDIAEHRNGWHVWFLDFGLKSTKRIAFAASWGQSEISSDQIAEIEPLLSRFKKVGVRELSGIEICEKCGYVEAKWTPDPTLLFDAKEYRRLYGEKLLKGRKQKYILVYWLNNKIQNPYKQIEKWAQSKDLEIRYIVANGNDVFPKEYVTIEEWLCSIDSAEFVITNSYHCCLFSLMFHVPFGVFPLQGHYASTNERINSLFKTLEISSRYIYDYNFDVLSDEMNFDIIDNRLEQIRKENDLLIELSSE